jgi:UV DNA damage endonuclease
MRLGFSVKPRGRPGLKPYDSRRWQNSPHLSVSLAYLRDILVYLHQKGISMYRMDSRLAPYLTHPEMPQFHGQIEECSVELKSVGHLARKNGVRLSFHAPIVISLSSPDDGAAKRAAAELTALARILDAMEMGPEAVVVFHGGGTYDDRKASLERLILRIRRLPDFVRKRLALEHDRAFTLADAFRVHQETGIAVVYDHLHYLNEFPRSFPFPQSVSLALSTWPREIRPKIHFSSPRTAVRVTKRTMPDGSSETLAKPPRWDEHSDFVNPFSFLAFLQATRGLREFDVMVEAKGTDLALMHLRSDMARYAPRLATTLEGPGARIGEEEMLYAAESGWGEEEEPERVLVAVVNNRRDFVRIREQGWYRIPVRRAPNQVAADYLAFYQTGVFGKEGRAVRFFAPVRRYLLRRRRDLLPEESNHPHANDWYYKVEVGPLQALPSAISGGRTPRITFVPTTMERLRSAREVKDLWLKLRSPLGDLRPPDEGW